jgi:hypothetical protein
VIRRVDRRELPTRQLGVRRRPTGFLPFVERPDPELALAYSNGFVTVEISHDALDRYVDMYGDVPLPMRQDRENGDRRVFDAKHNVRVIYDADAQIREVNTRSREGLHVRINFPTDRSQKGAA